MKTPEIKNMLEQLIALPSVSCTSPRLDQSNRPVVELLANWLEPLGFQCEIMEVSPGKVNLIATLGQGSGGLVLSGHTDTVPFNAEKWRFDPFTLTEAEGKLFGLGTADMKGFFPMAIEAAKAFLDQPLKAPIIILATCDEESSMAGAKALVEAGKPKARFAVIGEPTGLKPIRMHKGIMMERVLIEGRSGHSSDPSLGANALDAMHGVISELMKYREELKTRFHSPVFTIPTPTMNLGCIHGGDNPNRICASCELQYDLRLLPGMEMDELRGEIKRRLEPLAPQYNVKIIAEPIVSGVPPVETPSQSPLVQLVEKLTGHTSGAVAFATEAPYFSQLGMDALIIGPGDIEQAHQPDEFIRLDRIKPTVDLLQSLIKQFCL